MDEATKYKQYLKGLERIEAKTKLDKATKKVKDMLSAKAAEKASFVKRRMELAGKGALDYAKKAAKASKYGKIAGAVAAAGIAGSAFLRSKMKDIKEKQQAEGKMGAQQRAKASKYGKIAGVQSRYRSSAYLRSKMKDIKEKQQAEGKMGGGMMYKYKSGGYLLNKKRLQAWLLHLTRSREKIFKL
jgi:hypothetical protein